MSVPKRPQRLPNYLTSDEVQKLLDATAVNRVEYCRRRDYAIIATFAFTGIRRGELLSLRRDKGHGHLFTTTHGNRIHPSRMQMIWANILARSGTTKSRVVMHTLRHSRLDTTAVYLHVRGQAAK